MKRFCVWAIVALCAAVVGPVSPATAAVLNDNCTYGLALPGPDVTPTLACFGVASENDDAALLNAIGAFNGTDWDLVQKYEVDESAFEVNPDPYGFSITGVPGSEGTWSADLSGLMSPDTILAFVVKAGNDFFAYQLFGFVFDDEYWSTAALGNKDVSHFSVYKGTVAPVPLPPALCFLAVALAGLGIIGSRRRRHETSTT